VPGRGMPYADSSTTGAARDMTTADAPALSYSSALGRSTPAQKWPVWKDEERVRYERERVCGYQKVRAEVLGSRWPT